MFHLVNAIKHFVGVRRVRVPVRRYFLVMGPRRSCPRCLVLGVSLSWRRIVPSALAHTDGRTGILY